jgi:hypothetical protein
MITWLGLSINLDTSSSAHGPANRPRLVHLALLPVGDSLSGVQGIALANGIWAAGTVIHYNEAFMNSFVTRAAALSPTLSLQQTATILWGMGRLRFRDDAACDMFAQRVTDSLAALRLSGAGQVPSSAKVVGKGLSEAAGGSAVAGVVGGGLGWEISPEGTSYAQSLRAGDCADRRLSISEVGQCLSMSVHALSTLGHFCTPSSHEMLRAVLAFSHHNRALLSKQSLANICWSAAVTGTHMHSDSFPPLFLEALVRGDEMNVLELAQLAQVDMALGLEAEWYNGNEWLTDGNHQELLSGLYWLGATRCDIHHSHECSTLQRTGAGAQSSKWRACRW